MTVYDERHEDVNDKAFWEGVLWMLIIEVCAIAVALTASWALGWLQIGG